MRRCSQLVIAVPLAFATQACSGSDEADAPPGPNGTAIDSGRPETSVDAPYEPAMGDLVVDSDRNGLLEPHLTSEQAREEEWDSAHGAIFMANVDDDDGDRVGDHLDELVNGPEDAADLARIRIVGADSVPSDAVGRLSVDAASAPWVRLFRVDGDQFVPQDPENITLNASELETGLELAIEAKFFTVSLDPTAWSGFTDIEHVVVQSGVELTRDRVRMRVAPIVFMHNLMQTERVWAGAFDEAFVDALNQFCDEAEVPLDIFRYDDPGYADDQHDQWTQDHFEMGYASMPAPGSAHVMLVAFRTPRVVRTSADVVFVELLGPDFGAIHVHSQPYDEETRSLDSTGNWDTIPPHEANGVSYPQGRFLLGSVPERHADTAAEAFVEAQRVQPILRVDTSWLSVGHVDELLSFVPATNERGWQLLFARPSLAVDMLTELQSQGHGAARMHEGKWWWWGPASRSIDEVLANADLMATNQEDQVVLDGILIQLRDELDLADDDITYMPFLEYAIAGGSVAYQPGSVNLLHVNGHLLLPDPFGPRIGGKDPFREDLDERLGNLGLTTHYVDDWDLYHRNNGEVHCATNVLRAVPPNDAWWEGGR